MTTHEYLLLLAEAKIYTCPSRTLDGIEIRAATTVLLADLLTVACPVGVGSTHWAAAAYFSTSCPNKYRERQARKARCLAKNPPSDKSSRRDPAKG